MPRIFEDWHRGQNPSLLSHSLQRQRCRHGNKSMDASLDLQTLQTETSLTPELLLVSLDIRFNWAPPAAPLQQEAVSSTSLSPHPSRLSLLWCAYTWSNVSPLLVPIIKNPVTSWLPSCVSMHQR